MAREVRDSRWIRMLAEGSLTHALEAEARASSLWARLIGQAPWWQREADTWRAHQKHMNNLADDMEANPHYTINKASPN